MNRQARRAAERRQKAALAVRVGDLSVQEAEVITEALDQYALKFEQESDLHTEQVWAIGRARALRDMFQAAIDGRPPLDPTGDREPT